MKHEFKIGDKVQFKGSGGFLGYVSHVHKGHLFLLDDFEVNVHLGNGEHLTAAASDLELFGEKESDS